MSPRRAVPNEAVRFLREGRASHGYMSFLKYLNDLREESIYLAIHGSERDAREINAGRAQAWTEILTLFTDS